MSSWSSARTVTEKIWAHYTCMTCYLTRTYCVFVCARVFVRAFVCMCVCVCVCTCLCVIYKGCNQRCHNVSVPVGEVPHCLSGEKHTHKHTHTAGQVGVFLPLSHGEKEEIVEADSMRSVEHVALYLYTTQSVHQSFINPSIHLSICLSITLSFLLHYFHFSQSTTTDLRAFLIVCMYLCACDSWFVYVIWPFVCVFIHRPNRRGTTIFSMRCWQVFLLMRSAHSICRKLRLTTIWIRCSEKYEMHPPPHTHTHTHTQHR